MSGLRLTHIERYVMIRSLLSVAGALAVLSSLIVLVNFEELTRSSGARAGDASVLQLLGLALLESPSVILLVLPFAFLFGVLGAFVSLNRRSELIAMRAAGVSAWRFIFPAAGAAALIGLITVVALNPLASQMSNQFERTKTQLFENAAVSKTIWLRQGDKRRQLIIRAKSNQGPGVHLRDVTLFLYDVQPGGGLKFSSRMEASDAVLKKKQWTLTGVHQGAQNMPASTIATMVLPSTLSENNALERFASPTAIPSWELPSMIRRTELAGFSATAYRLQFQQLLATPLMFAAMSLLAAAFSLRLLRLGGLAGLAGAGVALGFIFFFFNQLCSSLGKADILPPLVAAWTPPTLALLSGLTLLCFTEDG